MYVKKKWNVKDKRQPTAWNETKIETNWQWTWIAQCTPSRLSFHECLYLSHTLSKRIVISNFCIVHILLRQGRERRIHVWAHSHFDDFVAANKILYTEKKERKREEKCVYTTFCKWKWQSLFNTFYRCKMKRTMAHETQWQKKTQNKKKNFAIILRKRHLWYMHARALIHFFAQMLLLDSLANICCRLRKIPTKTMIIIITLYLFVIFANFFRFRFYSHLLQRGFFCAKTKWRRSIFCVCGFC